MYKHVWKTACVYLQFSVAFYAKDYLKNLQ